MQILPAFRVGQVNDASVEPTQQVDSLLAIGFPCVFDAENRMVEDGVAAFEIQAAKAEVGLPFGFVPSDHTS